MIFDRVARVSFAGVQLDPVTDLRIQFTADKHDGLQLNQGTITIFNLSENARNTIARPYPLDFPMIDPVITVFLKAGYRGQDVQMFAGDLMSATNERVGPDWRTVIQMFSGFNVITKADVDVSIDKPTPPRSIADRLLAPLKIDVRYTSAAAAHLKKQTKVPSYSESALSFRAAYEFLDRYGLAFTIEEDGQGLVYVDDRPRDPDASKSQENTFSPDNGLIGTPRVTRYGIEIRSLLRPNIRIMQRFFVESDTIRGTLRGGGRPTGEYHVTKVSHTGDTRGEDWFTEVEGAYSNLVEGEYGKLK